MNLVPDTGVLSRFDLPVCVPDSGTGTEESNFSPVGLIGVGLHTITIGTRSLVFRLGTPTVFEVVRGPSSSSIDWVLSFIKTVQFIKRPQETIECRRRTQRNREGTFSLLTKD